METADGLTPSRLRNRQLENALKVFNGLLVIGILQSFSLFADDNSARRYAALDRDKPTCELFLLSSKPVQKDLKLTEHQIKALESTMSLSLTNDPTIVEYRRTQKLLLAAASSDEERAKIRREGNEKYSLLVKQYTENAIQSDLSSAQSERLGELFLQMKGPRAILEDTNVIQKLNLSKEQMSQINDDWNSDGKLLSLLRQRFLRLQIQPIRKRDRADLDSEMKSLVQVIKEVEKDRDAGILAALSEDQRRSWNDLCGPPVSIDWKMDFFSDTPFQKEKAINNK